MPTPDADLAARLVTAGVGTLGTSIFIGADQPVSAAVPELCCFVRTTGGPKAQETFQRLKGIRSAAVQVAIRSPVNDFATGQAKANAVRAGAHGQTVSGYLDVEAQSSEPLYLGKDDQDRHHFSVNFLMRYLI